MHGVQLTRKCLLSLMLAVCAAAVAEDTIRIARERFLDKCKGAWAGQMIGVAFGGPTEWGWGCEGFLWAGRPNLSELRAWKPELIAEALKQDDVYVEMTFLKALEDYGIGITPKQAGRAFAQTTFDLWHANLFARENVRLGIMPPRSGHPKHNLHANDIDFQIESDLFGIVCPGLPRESNRLCDVFGHIMCYGDGVYGGMFVAGMYAAAYREDRDVRAVVESGLACIPEKSAYRRCVSDVLRWHDACPEDWLATWRKIEDKWQDNMDCEPYWKSNINAKLNGAYAVLGLIHGNGDMARTLEVATRCGQDSDCNPSTAAGILGCMKGFNAIEPQWVSGLETIRREKFSNTDYSFDTLIPACQRIAEQTIRRAGGTVESDAYVIPRQKPRAPRKLEQWTTDQSSIYPSLMRRSTSTVTP
jgi:hypothetical protein